MRFVKRGLLVAGLSVVPLMAMVGTASAALPNGPYTASGSLTLTAGLGSTCSVTATGSIDAVAETGTVATFGASSCSGATSAISSSGTWTMDIDTSTNVVTITSVAGSATVLGTNCAFANNTGGLIAAWDDANQELDFTTSSALQITNTCAFGLIQPGTQAQIRGSLAL